MADPANSVEPQQENVDVAPVQGQAPAEEDRVEALVMTLEPGDHEHLAQLLRQHPGLRDEILAQAAEQLGNETVSRALEILAGPAAAPKSTEYEPPAPSEVEPVQEVAKQEPAKFEWLLSPLALEGGTLESRVREHVEFIQAHPELREAVLDQCAMFEPELASAVRAALEGAPSKVEPEPMPEQPNAVEPVQAPPQEPARFDYILSPLALEGGTFEGRAQEHVDFIRLHPELREAVLLGCAEFEPQLADRVRELLAAPPVPLEVETPAPPPAVVEQDVAEVAPPQAEVQGPAPTPAPEAKSEKPVPGWVTRARGYNHAHAAIVQEFNELTSFSCVSAMGWIEGESVEGLEVDPYLVADWQVAHGVAPDGRVGSNTVEAARALAMPAQVVAPSEAPDAEPPPA